MLRIIYEPGNPEYTWCYGDVDYDGDVDADDETLLNAFYNQSVE